MTKQRCHARANSCHAIGGGVTVLFGHATTHGVSLRVTALFCHAMSGGVTVLFGHAMTSGVIKSAILRTYPVV